MEPSPFHHIRHLKKRAFLVAYSECGNIVRAAAAAGVHRSSHFHWVKGDEAYADAFREAERMAGFLLEAEARRRAAEGIDKPVYYQGQVVGTVKEYSDTLLIFLLKGALPDKYREGWDFERRLAALEEQLRREGKP
jgi:hypothetical protein